MAADTAPGTTRQQDGEASAAERARTVTALFREHNQSLLRFLTGRLHSVHEAREVAQEAYVRLLQLDRPAVHSFLRAYLFRIAANLAVDRLRRRGAEARATQAEPFDEPDETLGPERTNMASEELAFVMRCLSELPQKTRRAFLMHRVDGRKVEEIAACLGVSGRMVRYHIERALVYCQLRLGGATAAQACERMKR